VRVERDFYPVAMGGVCARGWDPRKAATIQDPITINQSQPASADLAAGCYRRFRRLWERHYRRRRHAYGTYAGR
jgi:hypothetical protein